MGASCRCPSADTDTNSPRARATQTRCYAVNPACPRLPAGIHPCSPSRTRDHRINTVLSPLGLLVEQNRTETASGHSLRVRSPRPATEPKRVCPASLQMRLVTSIRVPSCARKHTRCAAAHTDQSTGSPFGDLTAFPRVGTRLAPLSTGRPSTLPTSSQRRRHVRTAHDGLEVSW